MKKYYATFFLEGTQYVMRFKSDKIWTIAGQIYEEANGERLSYAPDEQIIAKAALGRFEEANKFELAWFITKEKFKELRIRGVSRWEPATKIIE